VIWAHVGLELWLSRYKGLRYSLRQLKPCIFLIFIIYIYMEKHYLAPSTTSDLLFRPLKYQKLLNGPPNYQTVVF
jgi:hypothetical protein